jgi:quercetin dioxygenase-like cupin family protein
VSIPEGFHEVDMKLVKPNLAPGEPFHRNILYDGLYDRLPRDPTVKVRIFTGELAPGANTDWHIHNGSSFFLVVQGSFRVEFEGGSFIVKAGEVFIEEIGRVHRVVNMEKDISVVAFAVLLTAPDREHIVSVKEPW